MEELSISLYACVFEICLFLYY